MSNFLDDFQNLQSDTERFSGLKEGKKSLRIVFSNIDEEQDENENIDSKIPTEIFSNRLSKHNQRVID